MRLATFVAALAAAAAAAATRDVRGGARRPQAAVPPTPLPPPLRDDTGMDLWPMPASVTRNMSACFTVLRDGFAMVSVGPQRSAVLDAALARYRQILFTHGAGAVFPGRDDLLTTLLVNVTHSESEVPLDIGVDESYTLSVGADGAGCLLYTSPSPRD